MVLLDPKKPFSLEDFKKAAFGRDKVHLSIPAKARVQKSYKTLLSLLKTRDAIYGIHTGVGVLQSESSKNHWDLKQRELIASHACGVGEPLGDAQTRAIIFLRARVLVKGFSGIKPETLGAYISLAHKRDLPRVPSRGSVGACGDLIPLAHIAHHLFKTLPSGALGPRDGLALVNGAEASLAAGLISWIKASQLFENSLNAATLSLYAIGGKTEAFDERLVGLKKHPSSIRLGRAMKSLLGSYKNLGLPQDPYSFRAIPQVLGAVIETHQWAGDMLFREADSVTDNPVILDTPLNVLHGANFHGIHVALACDLESWALNMLCLMSERRTNALLSGDRGLPSMLGAKPGASGMMMVHVAQSALTAANKILAHPASADSIPTSANQEDVVPMAMEAALKFGKVLETASYVLGAEALCAARAIHLGNKSGPLKDETKLYSFFENLKEAIGPNISSEDKPHGSVIERIASGFLKIKQER